MSFAETFLRNSNLTQTENGAVCYSTTNSALLDLFSSVGALRSASETRIKEMWHDARKENPYLADNLVLYSRNIRDGGCGERRTGRILLKALAEIEPQKITRNFDTIISAGRWDDLFVFFDTPAEAKMIDFIKNQLIIDIENMKKEKSISLLAKWCPSINTSSKETKALGRKLCYKLGLSEKKYRKMLSKLRGYLKVVEKRMSAKEFALIDYEAVPSLAMTKYRKAFCRNDEERFKDFITNIKNGKAKINSGVSYPYELIRPYVTSFLRLSALDDVLEEQWKALPNYVEGNHNVICMADVSGSMKCNNSQPLATSIALSIYFAERNKGRYNGLVMSFTDVPELFKLNKKDSLFKRVNMVINHVGFSTDLDLAFRTIYDLAIEAKEAPEALVVISDMEIDHYCSHLKRYGKNLNSIVDKWREKYQRVGLVAPKLILWNVEARNGHYLANEKTEGVSFISGYSAAAFKELTNLIQYDAYEVMVRVLSEPQYSWA